MYFDKDICNTAAIEYALLKELSGTDEQRNINLINHQKTAFLLNIMKNNNLNEMINTERTIILNELNYYKDSLAMENSYIKAIQDINLMLYQFCGVKPRPLGRGYKARTALAVLQPLMFS